jgi:hypothetical protein
MATKAKSKKTEPKKELESITSGHYSTRTIHGDGRVEFVIDWDHLRQHVNEAIEEFHRTKLVEEAPYQPGYEGAVITQEKPKKTTRKKKA